MRPNELYRLYSSTDALLYIGITDSISRRLAQHRADKPWWGEVVTIKVERFPTREDLTRAELDAIARERPKYNIANSFKPETIRPRQQARLAWGNDANRFDTVEDDDELCRADGPIQQRVWGFCPGCRAEALCRYVDNRWKPIDDLARCLLCGGHWPADDLHKLD